jgi:hypothetical protein
MTLTQTDIAYAQGALPFWKDITEAQRRLILDTIRPRAYAQGSLTRSCERRASTSDRNPHGQRSSTAA